MISAASSVGPVLTRNTRTGGSGIIARSAFVISSLASPPFRPCRALGARETLANRRSLPAGMPPFAHFHPTAAERRNGPSAARWVENKLNEINGVRHIEREAPHRARRVELLRHRHE
jgi:hypothetical protein